ncbi:pseudouridine synthase [Shewanella sp. AS16]|uniref:pseudouridine synthase n=1 Tax=Shewanella sp. AS16 TaxID=2907625 RepID=UPI003FA3AABD
MPSRVMSSQPSKSSSTATASTTPPEHRHFKLYKPFGYLSQFVQEPRKRKKLVGELFDFPSEIMAIGRLDHDSEGLLLLTTSGMASHRVRSAEVEKEYYVQVDGDMNDAALARLTSGVSITVKGERFDTSPCLARRLPAAPSLPDRGRKLRDSRHGPTCWLSITLKEGKNRQIRKMTAAVGFPTLRLVRVRIGDIHLDGMQAGEVRPLPRLGA